MPTLLEYFSFVYFGNGCMCAPFHEFADFKNWIEFQSHYKTLPTGPFGAIKTLLPAITKIGIGLFHLGLHVYVIVLLGMTPSAVGKSEFANIGSLPYKIFYYWVAVSGQR